MAITHRWEMSVFEELPSGQMEWRAVFISSHLAKATADAYVLSLNETKAKRDSFVVQNPNMNNYATGMMSASAIVQMYLYTKDDLCIYAEANSVIVRFDRASDIIVRLFVLRPREDEDEQMPIQR